MDNNLCDSTFDTQHAYIVDDMDDEPFQRIEINKYLKLRGLQQSVNNKSKFLVCENGHELIKCESDDIKCYFRHKNPNDLSSWHAEWQNRFDNTEISFSKMDGGLSGRRADAVIDDIVIEFQHSYISPDEVEQRKSDYALHNKTINWVIDCNEKVLVKKLEISNRFIIQFRSNHWKYLSFLSHDYIYLNIGDKIFRISPKSVKSHMIDVNEYKLVDDFVESIKNKINIWNDDIPIQCRLYHNQRGAGCGKTYESIQLLNNDPRFKHKNTFIYLTKMHSAKEVIYNELIEQSQRGALCDLQVPKDGENDKGKQYKIRYFNKKEDKKCGIIIGTIDSFMYAIGDKKNRDKDFFAGLVKSIKDGYVMTEKDGSINYSGTKVRLNKKCLVIIDEAQDLDKDYVLSVCEIMRNTYIDVYIIGDKLQSIWGEHNIHTFLEDNDLPNTTTIKGNGVNQVRRFHNIQFKGFVNGVIDFKKYNLPPIESICDKKCDYEHNDDMKPYKIFTVPTIYSDDTDDNKVNGVVEQIIDYMETEIKNNSYLPNNFMFIFPILSKNYLANMLEARLENFWIDKFNDTEYQNKVLKNSSYWKDKLNDDEYYQYVFLHKSDEGKSINLSESDNATRILSIHASKGTGREVVFLLGVTEFTLNLFSKQTNNLQYDSLLHVAITRQKKSLYVGIEENGDDINKRFEKFGIEINPNIKPALHISNINSFDKIIQHCSASNDVFKNIDEMFIIPNKYNELLDNNSNNNKDDDKQIIDMGHHIIRYWVFFYYIMYNIVNNEKFDKDSNSKKDQFKAKLASVLGSKITCYEYIKYCNILNKISSQKIIDKKKKKIDEIPILFFPASEKSKYSEYKITLINFMESIRKKIRDGLSKNKLPMLCPLECVILLYMTQIKDEGKYSDISIMDLYSIIYCYDECSALIDINHNRYNCLCSKSFSSKNKNKNQNLDIYKKIQKSIINHYDNIKKLERIYQNLQKYIANNLGDSNGFTYNIYHKVWFNGQSEKFSIVNRYNIIAYSNKYVINFMIKPQFNKLNFNDVMINSVFNTYMIMNPSGNNVERYDNKKIIICILTMDSEEPIFLNFNIEKNNKFLAGCIKDYLLKHCSESHDKIFNFYQYCKSNNNKKNVFAYTKSELGKLRSYDRLPEYIKFYFEQAAKEFKKANKKKQSDMIARFDDKDLFLKDLYDELEEAVNDYLGIDDDSDDDNSNDE